MIHVNAPIRGRLKHGNGKSMEEGAQTNIVHSGLYEIIIIGLIIIIIIIIIIIKENITL